MRSFPKYVASEKLEEDPHPASPSRVVDALLRMAAADSDASVGGSHGYNVVARDHTHERRLDGITDDGYSNPLWEHYQHSQHKKHSADWHGGGSSRKGHGKGKHPQQVSY